MKSLITSFLTIGLLITGIYFGFDWLDNNDKIRKSPIPKKTINLSASLLSKNTNKSVLTKNNILGFYKSKKSKLFKFQTTGQKTNSIKKSIITTNKNKSIKSSKKKFYLTKNKVIFKNFFSSFFKLNINKKRQSCNTEDFRLNKKAKNDLLKNKPRKVVNSVISNELFSKARTKEYSRYAIIVRFGATIYKTPKLKTKKKLIFGTKLPILDTTKKHPNFTKCLINKKEIWLKNNSIEIIADNLLTDDIFRSPGTTYLTDTIKMTIKAFHNKNGNKLSRLIYQKISLHLKESSEILIFTKEDIKNLTIKTILTHRKAGIPFSGATFYRLKPQATNYKKFTKTPEKNTAIFPKDKPIQFKFRKINGRWFFTGIIAHKNLIIN